MTWKLPLNQIGSGSSFILGPQETHSRFRETHLSLEQHSWLAEILRELNCIEHNDASFFSLKLEVEKQSDVFRVKAILRMNPQLECVRSLTQFRSAFEVDSEALFVRGVERENTKDYDLSETEMESYEHDGSGLLLSEFITDLIYTSLPDFPLCQPECRGLCVECGCNLNTLRECGRSNCSSSDLECPHAHFFQ